MDRLSSIKRSLHDCVFTLRYFQGNHSNCILVLIEQAIYKILSLDSGVSALVSDRITPGFLAQSTTYPAIAYRLVSREHISVLGSEGDGSPVTGGNRGSTGLAHPTFRFFCTADGPDEYGEAKQLAEAVWQCLQGYRGEVDDGLSPPTSVFIQTVTPDGETDYYDDPTQTHQIICDYEFWHSEQKPTP